MTRRIRGHARRTEDSALMTIKAIAFDLDDTLWAVTPVIIRAEKLLQAWFDEHRPGLDVSREAMGAYQEVIVRNDPSLRYRITEMRRRVIEATLRHGGDTETTAESMSHEGIEVFLKARNEIEFFEGALSTLRHLSAQYTLGALSNGNADIRRLGLSDVFTFAYSAEQVGRPKPAPDLFHVALETTGLAPTEMVYVGDNPEHDIDPANECGMHTVWVDNGTRDPGTSQPTVRISDIRDLPAAINAVRGEP